MTEEPLLIPLPREQVDAMVRASMFAQRMISEAMAGPGVPSGLILEVAEEFELRNRRKMTADERADPEAIARLLGVDLDAAEVIETAPAFQSVLDSIVQEEESAEAAQ